jgi:hypothetical protein
MRRRSNRTAKKKRLLLEAIANGWSVSAAAGRAAMSRRSIYDWRAAAPQFAADLADAFEMGSDRLAAIAMKRALSPEGDHCVFRCIVNAESGAS